METQSQIPFKGEVTPIPNTENLKDYEVAVNAFQVVDGAYQKLEKQFIDGSLVLEVASMSKTAADVLSNWGSAIERLKGLLEDRNVKLRSAKDALRQAVVLAPTQERGVDGKPTQLKYLEFKVSSVTHRDFDAKSLFDLAQKFNVLPQLLSLTKTDKEGNIVPLVKQTYEIDFDGVLSFLRAHKLDGIVTAAYAEKEKTPQVTGAKTLAFLGDEKKEG